MNEAPRNLFEVGEEVLILSLVSSPGNFLIRTIIDHEYSDVPKKSSNCSFIYDPGWLYKMDTGRWGHEKQLRKLHKPGDAFDKLMADLKRPIGVVQ